MQPPDAAPAPVPADAAHALVSSDAAQVSDLWSALRAARVPQIAGIHAGVSWGALQVVDMFVDRLGLPDWTFVGALLLVLAALPVLLVTAFAQHARKTTRFTWRNALRAGVVAVVLLVVAVGGFMVMRVTGIGPVGTLMAAGVLDARDRILIADFQSQTGDSSLARAVTEAFRIDFEQSAVVRVVDVGSISGALQRMQRTPDTAIDPDVAREIALREGVPAYVTGEINGAGRSFVLSVRLHAPGEGAVLVSLRETARDSAAVIAAVDKLSSRLRERIGESLRTIRAGEPLEQVSTGSLDALHVYSQAIRAIDNERDDTRGIALLEQAIALDSTFAMAWRKLGVALSNTGAPRARWEPALTRAFELAERLPPRERYLAQAAYYSTVEDDADRAIAAYESLLAQYPDDGAALNNLAVRLSSRGDHERAAELYTRALAGDSTTGHYYANLAIQYVSLGRWEDADSLIALYRRRFPGIADVDLSAARLASSRGDYTTADTIFARLYRSSNPRTASLAASGLAALELLHGRIDSAIEYSNAATDLNESLGIPAQPLERQALPLRIRFLVEGDTTGAIVQFDRILQSRPLEPGSAASGVHLGLAGLYATAGHLDRARALIAEWDAAELDERARAALATQRDELDALIDLVEGRFSRGISTLQRHARSSGCEWCYHSIVAIAFDMARQPDSVIAYYERYIDGPWFFRLPQDAWMLPRAHERLAQLYDARSDTTRAVEHYLRFAELWEDADPVLTPRVDTARQRISALTGAAREP